MGGDHRAGPGDDAAARALRDSRGTKYFAVVDGEPREVKAAKTRGRWDRLIGAARALGASCIEARDDDGATLAVVQLDEEQDAARDDERRADDSRAGELERLLGIVLRAQDAAVARQSEHVRSVTEAALSVMNAAAERAASMERAVLALVQQRERDLDAAAAELDATTRAVARAEAAARQAREDEGASELDAIATTLVREAVVPVVGQKIASMAAKKGAA